MKGASYAQLQEPSGMNRLETRDRPGRPEQVMHSTVGLPALTEQARSRRQHVFDSLPSTARHRALSWHRQNVIGVIECDDCSAVLEDIWEGLR
jgi:hypothetical protein